MLRGLRCGECGKLSVATGRGCPFCGAREGEVVPLSGRGRLLSWTVIRVAPPRYAAEAPYAIGVLQLDEGPRLTARLDAPPESLSAGQAVVMAADDTERGPIFRTP
jgi:uncharacterized OB-fold protein